jgi:hypothetical protein
MTPRTSTEALRAVQAELDRQHDLIADMALALRNIRRQWVHDPIWQNDHERLVVDLLTRAKDGT